MNMGFEEVAVSLLGRKVLATVCWCYDLHLLLVHFCLTVCLQCMAALVCIVNSSFYTGQQAANLAVLFAARSANLVPLESTLFATSIANVIKIQAVDVPATAWGGRKCRWCLLLCNPQPGSFKTRKQLITAVSPSLHPQTLRWTTGQLLRSRRCSVSSVSGAVWLC